MHLIVVFSMLAKQKNTELSFSPALTTLLETILTLNHIFIIFLRNAGFYEKVIYESDSFTFMQYR